MSVSRYKNLPTVSLLHFASYFQHFNIEKVKKLINYLLMQEANAQRLNDEFSSMLGFIESNIQILCSSLKSNFPTLPLAIPCTTARLSDSDSITPSDRDFQNYPEFKLTHLFSLFSTEDSQEELRCLFDYSRPIEQDTNPEIKRLCDEYELLISFINGYQRSRNNSFSETIKAQFDITEAETFVLKNGTQVFRSKEVTYERCNNLIRINVPSEQILIVAPIKAENPFISLNILTTINSTLRKMIKETLLLSNISSFITAIATNERFVSPEDVILTFNKVHGTDAVSKLFNYIDDKLSLSPYGCYDLKRKYIPDGYTGYYYSENLELIENEEGISFIPSESLKSSAFIVVDLMKFESLIEHMKSSEERLES